MMKPPTIKPLSAISVSVGVLSQRSSRLYGLDAKALNEGPVGHEPPSQLVSTVNQCPKARERTEQCSEHQRECEVP